MHLQFLPQIVYDILYTVQCNARTMLLYKVFVEQNVNRIYKGPDFQLFFVDKKALKPYL